MGPPIGGHNHHRPERLGSMVLGQIGALFPMSGLRRSPCCQMGCPILLRKGFISFFLSNALCSSSSSSFVLSMQCDFNLHIICKLYMQVFLVMIFYQNWNSFLLIYIKQVCHNDKFKVYKISILRGENVLVI